MRGNLPLFSLGRLVGSPGAVQMMARNQQDGLEFIQRHVTGDWGDVPADEAAQNAVSLEQGLRLHSSYRMRDGTVIWLITEGDRAVTTLLLPSEY